MVAELRIEIEHMSVASTFPRIEIVDLSEQNFCDGVIAKALRLASQGKRILIVQMLKGGIRQGYDRPLNLAQNLDWIRNNLARQITTPDLSELEILNFQQLWKHIKAMSISGCYDAIAIEHLDRSIELGAIDLKETLDWLNHLPADLSIVLAGDNIHPEIAAIVRQPIDSEAPE
jgi:cob(I)alamin adenosyltransferase